ncbi:hypothetical protein [Streptomyces sp. NPDC058874]|uniref:hypothetical protein n=1 Tax=unclassified Streptomyces TaxID=2593676 RepID=UPI0036AEFBB5
MSIWRTLAHSSRLRLRASFSPDIVWNRLDNVDFTPAARLDPTADNLVGDVTGRYEPREPFAFVLAGS